MSLQKILELFTIKDVIDIALVALVIYYLLVLIRGTRAVQVLLGILFVAVAYTIAGIAGLLTLEGLLENFLIVLPFAIIVLFQQEMRRALATFGRNPLLGLANHQRVESTFTEIVLAATALSDRRIGGLIVIERGEGLRNYIENGIELDSTVSYDLLINLFTPGTPLHDGAAIIQGDRLAAAACFLPLTLNPELSKEFGTRHRAALGISEETDAIAVVVSEETAQISAALNGELIRNLDGKSLRNLLYERLITEPTTPGWGASE